MYSVEGLKDYGLVFEVSSEAVGHTSPATPVPHVNESNVYLISTRIDISVPVDKTILGNLDYGSTCLMDKGAIQGCVVDVGEFLKKGCWEKESVILVNFKNDRSRCIINMVDCNFMGSSLKPNNDCAICLGESNALLALHKCSICDSNFSLINNFAIDNKLCQIIVSDYLSAASIVFLKPFLAEICDIELGSAYYSRSSQNQENSDK